MRRDTDEQRQVALAWRVCGVIYSFLATNDRVSTIVFDSALVGNTDNGLNVLRGVLWLRKDQLAAHERRRLRVDAADNMVDAVPRPLSYRLFHIHIDGAARRPGFSVHALLQGHSQEALEDVGAGTGPRRLEVRVAREWIPEVWPEADRHRGDASPGRESMLPEGRRGTLVAQISGRPRANLCGGIAALCQSRLLPLDP